MLLEFKMKNFKSYKDEMEFKMLTAPKIKDLEDTLVTKKIEGKSIKVLSTAVIYGPNSSGKTNIISGMEVLRSIFLKGSVQNKELVLTRNMTVNRLSLAPNINSEKDEPVKFYIKFVTNDLMIEIRLDVLLGEFNDEDAKRKIVYEELKINNSIIYSRDKELRIGNIDIIKNYWIDNFSMEVAEKISKSNLDEQDLFLNGMFKNLYSKKIFDIIYNWFQNEFVIIYRADQVKVSPRYSEKQKDKKFYIDKLLNKAAKDFGVTKTTKDIVYPITEKSEMIRPLSLIQRKDKISIVPSEDFESFGTIRFLNVFPLIAKAITSGATLVIDELDASIHPMAIMNIINIFHNPDINKRGAQLIFNTHNPIYLNNAILRRDEIKFVERQEDGNSVHYSLSDFGTNGENGVRNTEDYMKKYFINKYGAIENVDFSNVFENEE